MPPNGPMSPRTKGRGGAPKIGSLGAGVCPGGSWADRGYGLLRGGHPGVTLLCQHEDALICRTRTPKTRAPRSEGAPTPPGVHAREPRWVQLS